MIPLHAGCKILVSKMDLIKIYTSNAALYSSRLMEAVFSAEELNFCKELRSHDHLESLDKERICSIITHVVQVFSARGRTITEQMVKKFLEDKLSTGRIAFE